MNVADSEVIVGVLARSGYVPAAAPELADVILLNTCAIREHAEQRVAQRIRGLLDLRRSNPCLRIGLAGCMAQHHRQHLLDTIPGLDFVVGPDGYRRLPELIEAEGAVAELRLDRKETYADITPLRGQGVRAWLTIMRGCNRFCTFCVVPYVRGRERSIPAAVLIEELKRIASTGFCEVVLLGQTVNAYNHDGVDFATLLRMCARVDGIERIRFTSPHPANMTDPTIEALGDCPKLVPYLHLPLQSGSDRVLRAMNRGHTVEQYRRLVGRLRAAVADLALSTDIIVGYPGESEEDFEATSGLMEEIGFDHAFLFKYCRRQATRAAGILETVSEQEKGRRLERLIAEQEKRAWRINQEKVGGVTQVLVEAPAKRQPSWLAGKNPQFKTVVFEPRAGTRPGDLVDVLVESATSHTLRGRQIKSQQNDTRSRKPSKRSPNQLGSSK